MALSDQRPNGNESTVSSPQPWKLKNLWEKKKTPPKTPSKTPPKTPPKSPPKTPPPETAVPSVVKSLEEQFLNRPNRSIPVTFKVRKYDADEKGKSIEVIKKRSSLEVKYELPFIEEAKRKEELAAAAKAAEKNQSSLAALKAMVMTRRRLRLDPEKHLYFLHDPGQQVSSAIKIKNVSKGHVAFKFQTNAPKSCFMRPNSGVLAPKETLIATVMKFIEPVEGDQERKTKDKFKILSLPMAADKVEELSSYASELFDYQKDLVAVESILRVIYLDPNKATPEQVNKIQTRLKEAEAADEARLKPGEESTVNPAVVADALIVDQWRKQREKFKRQQVQGGG